RPASPALAAALQSLLPPVEEPVATPPTTGVAALPLFAAAPSAASPATDEIAVVSEWNVNVRAVRATDEVAEAQHAALQVRAWIEQGIAPDEIAVVVRDPQRVAALVQHAFRERGVAMDAGARADSGADAFVHALVG